MNRHIRDHELQRKISEKAKAMEIPRQLMQEQHDYNEALFKKQAELTRDIHKKQTNLTIQMQDNQESLTIVLAIISLFAVLGSAVLGAVVGSHFSNESQVPSQKVSQTETSTSPPNKQQSVSYKEASSPNPTLNQTTNDGSDLDKVKVNKQ